MSRQIICSFIFLIFLVTVTGIGQAMMYLYPPHVDNESNVECVGSLSVEGGAVDVVGNYAYITNGTGIDVVDISNSYSPIFKGSYKTTGYAQSISVSGNYAYITNGTGIDIVDISNPSSPFLKGSYNTGRGAYDVSVSGNYAYIADDSDGLVIVDISNPSSPFLKGSYNTGRGAFDVSVSGNYAYITDSTGINIIDISNPSSPFLKGSYNNGGNYFDVSVSGNYAYITNGTGIDIVDIEDPSSPILVGSYFPVLTYNYNFVPKGQYFKVPGEARKLSVSGSYAYILGNYGLVIVDITDPSAPTLVGSYCTSGSHYIEGAGHFSVSDNYIYVCDASDGLVILKANIQNQELTVGQGASIPEITQKFNDAYNRSGGLSVIGNPTTKVHSAFGFEVQDFPELPATSGGVIMYNPNNKNAYFIHGAIWDKYYAYPDADKAKLGPVADDEKEAAVLPGKTTGRYTKFETGTIHWISNKGNDNLGHPKRGESFVTYGDLDTKYAEMKGTYGALGFPIMDEEMTADGHGYCEFEGGYIKWNGNEYSTHVYSQQTIEGRVDYPELADLLPLKYAKIEVDVDRDPNNGVLASSNTASDGSFKIKITDKTESESLYMRVYADSEGSEKDKVSVSLGVNNIVYYPTTVSKSLTTNNIVIPIEFTAFPIYGHMLTAYDFYVNYLELNKINVVLDNLLPTGMYDVEKHEIEINPIHYLSTSDTNELYHEYSHFVMDTPHQILAKLPVSPLANEIKSQRLNNIYAWYEGWAVFGSAAVNGADSIKVIDNGIVKT